MLKNYFKIAMRNLFKHKAYSFINIFGLSLGMACVMLIFLYLHHETSVDSFHANGNRIYRVLRLAYDNNQIRKIGVTSGPYKGALETDFPADVEEATRVMVNDALVTYGDKKFSEKKFYFADANFFSFFSFPLKQGDPSSVLKDPSSVVISEAMALKYFGQDNPIGKVIRCDDRYDFRVTGVFGPPSAASHLDFDWVASIDVFKERSWFNQWWNNSLFTYVRVNPSTDISLLIAKLPAFMDKYFGDNFQKTGRRMDLDLEPLASIYLNKETSFDLVPHGDRMALYIFAGVSLLLLLIACMNFMNLSTARSTGRAKEVGLRKVMGAYRQNLIFQFLGESAMLSLIAMVIAFCLAEIALPYLNTFLEKDLSWGHIDVGTTLLVGIALMGIIGLAAGSYPAFFLSAFQPAAVLKGATAVRKSSVWKALVVFQFSISIFLIIATIAMNQQMDFVTAKDLGFDNEQVVIVPINNRDIYEHRESFKKQLLQSPFVQRVSLMSGEPGGFHDNMAFQLKDQPGEFTRLRTVYTDFDYAKTFGLKIIAGRDFSKLYGTDASGMLLNEKAVKAFGWKPEEAIGKQFQINLLDSAWRTVIGVVADYNFTSLKQDIDPLALSIYSDHRVVAVKIKGQDVPAAIAQIERVWSSVASKFPFEFKFLDQSFASLYRSEIKQRELLSVFSVLAVCTACLGLLGLASFSTEKRTKEIGVRKILGASVVQLTGLLTKEFVSLVLAANIIAAPIAYFVIHRWLQEFAYRIDINIGMFLLAASIAFMIALLTVSYQAIRAATANPVEALKYE